MSAINNVSRMGNTALNSNTSFGIQNDRQNLTNLTHNQPLLAFGNQGAQGTLRAEQGMMTHQLNSQMLYNASGTAADAQDKLIEKNVKRGFSTFA